MLLLLCSHQHLVLRLFCGFLLHPSCEFMATRWQILKRFYHLGNKVFAQPGNIVSSLAPDIVWIAWEWCLLLPLFYGCFFEGNLLQEHGICNITLWIHLPMFTFAGLRSDSDRSTHRINEKGCKEEVNKVWKVHWPGVGFSWDSAELKRIAWQLLCFEFLINKAFEITFFFKVMHVPNTLLKIKV